MTRVLILGGGVAGLDLASNLGRSHAGRAFEIGLVDREPAHVWKPLLHTIASGTADASVQQTPYLAQSAARGFRFHPGAVTAIDRHSKTVAVAATMLDGEEVLPVRRIGYDVLIVALGSSANDFGTPGFAEHCFTIDSRGEALRFNDRIRVRLCQAALAGGTLTIGIVGGGATGVEMAAELIRFAAIAEGLGLDGAGECLKIVLLNADDRLLSAFPEKVSAATLDTLRRLGVEVRSGARVSAVDESGFILEGGGRVDAEIKVWAAGIRAPAVLATLDGLDRTRGGQLVVGATLVATGDPAILAIGDCASVTVDTDAPPVPATAQAAFQQAAYLCRHLPAIVADRDAPPFRYHDFGSLVSLGGYDAYGSLGKFGFLQGGFIRGKVAQLGHALLYRRHQVRLYGMVRGSLLWMSDAIASRIKPFARIT